MSALAQLTENPLQLLLLLLLLCRDVCGWWGVEGALVCFLVALH